MDKRDEPSNVQQEPINYQPSSAQGSARDGQYNSSRSEILIQQCRGSKHPSRAVERVQVCLFHGKVETQDIQEVREGLAGEGPLVASWAPARPANYEPFYITECTGSNADKLAQFIAFSHLNALDAWHRSSVPCPHAYHSKPIHAAAS